MPRQTLAGEVALSGEGLHSGAPVSVILHASGAGIVFRRGKYRVAATPENVSDTTRCTKLGEISTVEHLMSALAGLDITDVEIEVTGPELPGLDGSALIWVQAISAVGVEPIGSKDVRPPFKRIFYREDGGPMIAVAAGVGHWRYEYASGDRWPRQQCFEASDIAAVYATEVAPARTFANEEDVERLRAAGLGQGLNENSALILGASGYLNQERFSDEPARHKLLDLIGDLYLAGLPIRLLDVVAIGSGHRSNVEAAKLLAAARGRAPEA